MAEHKDFNDVLEEIFLKEDTIRQESYAKGFQAGTEAGNTEGYHLGYHRGAELGRELGYYLGIVTHYLKANEKAEIKYADKITNQLTRVKDLINSFPKTNVDDQDILGLLDNIRAQYKKTCALLKIPSTNPYDANISF